MRIVIVGATSLRGKELVEVLKERFPSADLKLLDEEIAAGVLTDAAGEPAIVQSVDDESFEGARIVFFAGKPDFSAQHAAAALRGAPNVIDMSGGSGTGRIHARGFQLSMRFFRHLLPAKGRSIEPISLPQAR